MRLKKIKLAGFKSFVDPTNIYFPAKWTSILGPNGCGKSNVIDAVRWVMGESSAKYLRGETVNDVIFNGSETRQPIAQASVELLFENNSSALIGEYAKYDEISIRRVCQRDGQSTYYLNKSRCRRKDIRDLFLGTGLGPRSYAIIEQGMISRLIEAKPEEVRIYIEEAAGISKYKERRKETETRLLKVHANLARLNDIQVELETQLSRLKKQARSAKKYRELKQQSRQLQAELYAIRWRDFQRQIEQSEQLLEQQSQQQHRYSEQKNTLSAKIAARQVDIEQKNHQLNQIQGDFYQQEANISRQEQQLSFLQKQQQERQIKIEQLQHNQHKEKRECQENNDKTQENTSKIHENIKKSEELEKSHELLGKQYQEVLQTYYNLREALNKTQQQEREIQHQLQLEQQKSQYLKKQIRRYQDRRNILESERKDISLDKKQQQIDVLEQQLEDANKTQADTQDSLKDYKSQLVQQQQQLSQAKENSQNARHQLNGVQTQLHSLQKVQHHFIAEQQKQQPKWLKSFQNGEAEHLYQIIKPVSGEEEWVEMLLHDFLQALLLDEKDYLQASDEASRHNEQSSGFALIENTIKTASNSDTPLNSLSTLVENPQYLPFCLQQMLIADCLKDALKHRKGLKQSDFIATRDGYFVGKNWLRKHYIASHNMFEREQRINQLIAEQNMLEKKGLDLQQQFQKIESATEQLQHTYDGCAKTQNEQQESSRRLKNQLEQLQMSLQQDELRLHKIVQEQQDIQQQLDGEQTELTELQTTIEQLQDNLRQINLQCAQAKKQFQQSRLDKEQLEKDRSTISKEQQSLQSQHHELQSEAKWLKMAVDKNNQQLQQLELQLVQIEKEILPCEQQIIDSQGELEQLLIKRRELDEQLKEARSQIDDKTHQLKHEQQQSNQVEDKCTRILQTIANTQAQLEQARARQEVQLEQLQQTDFTLNPLLLQLAEDSDAGQWEFHLSERERKIKALGNINLMAIDEYEQEKQRREFYQQQQDDLHEAISTLEQAIGKIDKETRSRFKTTFDAINQKMQQFFPQLFNGGKAYLEMSGENLLDTGVRIMARPPGKKNTSIQLLSGGEKALVSIAFIFAIFSLNPTPFCLLDEVDAPLDESNVNRFAQMLRMMSDQVQFISITHNKTTMEMSDTLCGVTMKEPGVSRVVEVDLQEAVDLVE